MTGSIALLEKPNSGKSTIFNNLTGARQHVGNWAGKTVEKNEGSYTYKGTKYTVTDLPGMDFSRRTAAKNRTGSADIYREVFFHILGQIPAVSPGIAA